MNKEVGEGLFSYASQEHEQLDDAGREDNASCNGCTISNDNDITTLEYSYPHEISINEYKHPQAQVKVKQEPEDMMKFASNMPLHDPPIHVLPAECSLETSIIQEDADSSSCADKTRLWLNDVSISSFSPCDFPSTNDMCSLKGSLQLKSQETILQPEAPKQFIKKELHPSFSGKLCRSESLISGKTSSKPDIMVDNCLHECEVCRKRFSNQTNLRTHQRIHSGIKPYKCDMCDKRFSDQSNTKRHMKTHIGSKPFVCKICKQQFTRATSVKRHYERFHEGVTAEACVPVHSKLIDQSSVKEICDICGQTFGDKAEIKKHRKSHLLKPFVCEICGKEFHLESGLWSRIHRESIFDTSSQDTPRNQATGVCSLWEEIVTYKLFEDSLENTFGKGKILMQVLW
eukprot:gene10183-11228_t